MKIIFSHGKESGPWGSKINQLSDVAKAFDFEVDSIDYRETTNPDERVKKLNRYLENEVQPYILVGSSMGGYVSLVAAKQYKPLGVFLLAPALYMPSYAKKTYPSDIKNIEVVHGWSDDVIPVKHSIKYAQQAKCSLHLIDGDHRLNSSIDLVIPLFKSFLLKIKNKDENLIYSIKFNEK